MMNSEKYDPIPEGHPFGDWFRTLQVGDAPCCPKPDEFKSGMGMRFVAKWVGANANARANLFRDKFIMSKPTADVMKAHFGAHEAMMILYLGKTEHNITLALPCARDEGDDWENESVHKPTAGAAPSTSRDSRFVEQASDWGDCTIMPTYS